MKIVSDINENIFREYDIRGIFPNDIDKNIAYTIGKSYGTIIRRNGFNKCIVGYDNRESSIELSVSLLLGILSTGMDVINLGLVTTPMILYAKEKLNCECYIMVTASHNPKEYNGFKFSLDNTGNARGDMINEFKEFTLAGDFDDGVGHISSYKIKDDYKKIFKDTIDIGPKRIKAVLDLANGTTAIIAKELYKMFDIDLYFINDESDANFPNHHPDPFVPSNQQQLIEKVKELNCDIGLGFDGDGDRVGIVDNKGNIVEADKFIAIMSNSVLNNSNDKRILYDVKCSKLTEDEIIKNGGEPIKCRTGASYTMSKVIDENIPFGGEFSGHIFFNDRSKTFGSGLYAGLRMIEVLSKSNESLEEMTNKLNKYYSTPQMEFGIDDSRKYIVMKDIKDYCIRMRLNIDDTDGVKILFKDGWALIRCSNTSPYISARFEANTEERLFGIKKEFINLINYYIKQQIYR